jgi:hypothetical protein
MSVWIVIIADAVRNAGTVYFWLYFLRSFRRPVAAERAPTVAELQKLEASVS